MAMSFSCEILKEFGQIFCAFVGRGVDCADNGPEWYFVFVNLWKAIEAGGLGLLGDQLLFENAGQVGVCDGFCQFSFNLGSGVKEDGLIYIIKKKLVDFLDIIGFVENDCGISFVCLEDDDFFISSECFEGLKFFFFEVAFWGFGSLKDSGSFSSDEIGRLSG